MRFATVRLEDEPTDRVGVLVGGRLHLGDPGSSLDSLLGDDGERLRSAGERLRADPDRVVELDAAPLRAPVPEPPSIRDFLGFEAHVRNARGAVDPDWYRLPVFYFSNPAAVHGPRDPVAVAPGSREFDFELECAAVVGMGGSDLAVDVAGRHLAGFMVMCDFSARDLQRQEMRLGLGPAKGKDSATSLGPFLVTPDELASFRSATAYRLSMGVRVNGTLYGSGNLSDLYWSFEEMLAYASRGTRVRPGDVIGSGTVGFGCILERVAAGEGDRFPWLAPGDVVELEIEQLGRLSHRIVVGTAPVPLRAEAQGGIGADGDGGGSSEEAARQDHR